MTLTIGITQQSRARFSKVITRLLGPVAVAWETTAREVTPKLRDVLKGQAQAGFPKSRRLRSIWRSRIYRNPERVLGLRGKVFPGGGRSKFGGRARQIVEGLVRGGVKTPRRAKALALPSPPVRRFRVGRKRITPKNWPEERWGPLVKISSGGTTVLIAPDSTQVGETGIRRVKGKQKEFGPRTQRRRFGEFGVRTPRGQKFEPLLAFTIVKRARALKIFDPIRPREKMRRRARRLFARKLQALQAAQAGLAAAAAARGAGPTRT